MPSSVQEDSQTQQRVVHPAEFETRKRAAGFQDAVRFFEDIGDRRAVPDTKRDGVQVIRVISELSRSKFLRVCLME
jgi:hypothetical protein